MEVNLKDNWWYYFDHKEKEKIGGVGVNPFREDLRAAEIEFQNLWTEVKKKSQTGGQNEGFEKGLIGSHSFIEVLWEGINT